MIKRNIILLCVILLLAATLRFWNLGKTPLSPDWDEVALGYNAYSIMQTGRDEYGKFLPIVLRSFEDYKPALYAYLIIPFIKVFGLTIFAVRLPSAILGVATVGAVYYLVRELFRRSSPVNADSIALLSSFLLAISPWHIQFSRVAFETNVGLACNVLMILFLLKGLQKYGYLYLSVVFAALSIYTYQSEKVFTPLLFLTFIFIYWPHVKKIAYRKVLLVLFIGLILTAPMLWETLSNKEALARARGVSIFSQKTELLKKDAERLIYDRQNRDYFGLILDNRRLVYANTIVGNYISHFDPLWMFVKGDYEITRHHAPNMGLEYIVFLPCLLVGIYQLIFGHFDRKTKVAIILWQHIERSYCMRYTGSN
jgi:4-amino-4-deoxy-L-arabinose transferase-like glycosyltransferase